MQPHIPQEIGDLISFHFPLNLVNSLGCFPYVQKIKLRENGRRLWSRYRRREPYCVNYVNILMDATVQKFDDRCVDHACGEGHLAVVEYFCKHANNKMNDGNLFTAHSMESAAKAGHLPIVKFLHGNNLVRKDYMGSAVNAAAMNGHVDIVRFLHGVGVSDCRISAREY